MSYPDFVDRFPERDVVPQFCPECNGAIREAWGNDVTAVDQRRVEGHECVNCSWACKIELPPVEIEP
jgi:uncharacterized protein with PIN domain